MIGGSALSVLGAYKSSKGNKDAYRYQAQIASNNAQLAEWQAQNAEARGKNTEANVRIHGAQMESTQRASMAARGIALDEGSPLRVLQDTEFMTEHDARTVEDNTAQEAWALRVQGGSAKANAGLLSARASAEDPLMNATGTLLTTGGTVADRWYRYNAGENTSFSYGRQ